MAERTPLLDTHEVRARRKRRKKEEEEEGGGGVKGGDTFSMSISNPLKER